MASMKYVRLTLAAAGTQVIEAAVTGQKHVVVSFSLDTSLVTALPQFESNTTVIAGPYFRGLAGSLAVVGSRVEPLFQTLPNEALELVTAGAGLVNGHVAYYTTEV
jgi:hypothetical protein